MITNFSFFANKVPTAITSAKALRKKAFCIVGKSPERRTKQVIRENPTAARMMHIIPVVWSLTFLNIYPQKSAGLASQAPDCFIIHSV